MNELILDEKIINNVKLEALKRGSALMKDNLIEVILYGSCARGDYTEDSDIDIALITKFGRMEEKEYTEALASIATTLAMFAEKKTWYAYFRNIEREGEVLYG